MRLAEVAHITETKVVDGRTIEGGYFTASFEGLCIREGGLMTSTVGFSPYSKRDARQSLARNVSNVTVMRSVGGVRTNYPLPKVTV